MKSVNCAVCGVEVYVPVTVQDRVSCCLCTGESWRAFRNRHHIEQAEASPMGLLWAPTGSEAPGGRGRVAPALPVSEEGR